MTTQQPDPPTLPDDVLERIRREVAEWPPMSPERRRRVERILCAPTEPLLPVADTA